MTSFGSGPLRRVRRLSHRIPSLELNLRNMQIHRLVAFLTSGIIQETRTTTFDLYTAASLRLDMLDVCAAVSNNLSPQIETWDGF